MQHEKNPKMWAALANCLFLFCTPLGLYTCFIGPKVTSSLRVGDLDRADQYVRKIKMCYKIAGFVWAILIILAIAFAD